MALINDPRIYSGGSERIDTRPHTQLYAQLKQREQARNDAFDEYMRNLNLKINPAGMRNQERIPFEEKLKEWQQKSIQNRDRIRDPRKDNGLAQMENQSGFQELLNMAAESKTAAEGLKPFIEVKTDPKKAALLNNDRAMSAVQAHDQPIYVKDESGRYVRNPSFKPFNASELEFHPEEFDIPKYLKNLDYIKPTDKSEEILSTDPATLKNKIRITSKFTPNDYDKMATIGVQTYYSDPSMKMLVDKMYNDPNNKEVLKLNDVFKSKFDKDISNPGDLAAAMTIAAKETTEQEVKMEDDMFAQRKALAKLNDGYVRGRMGLRRAWQQADKATQDTWVDDYIGKVVSTSRTPENRVTYKYKDGRVVNGYKVPMDELLGDAVGIDSENNQGQLVVTDDGDFVTAFFETKDFKPLKKGGTYVIDENRTRRYDRTRLKLNIAKKAGTAPAKEMNATDFGEEEETGILD
jgi:hypothetical protein